MGKITYRTKTAKIYTTSDGKKFTGKNALDNAKCYQTEIDLEALCDMLRPEVRELFGFSSISPGDMKMDEENFPYDDIEKAWVEEQFKFGRLAKIFGDMDNFDEFLEIMVRLLIQYREPMRELIVLFRAREISHMIVNKAKKS